MQVRCPPYSTDVSVPFSLFFVCFLNRKFIPTMRFEDMESIKRNKMRLLYIISKKYLRGALTNGKLSGINC